jgi:hypothetical protein
LENTLAVGPYFTAFSNSTKCHLSDDIGENVMRRKFND